MAPFRQEINSSPFKSYGFLFDNNNVSDSVRMGHSSSANETLIQYLWGAHSVPFGRKQLTIWNITHYLNECFNRRGIIIGYDTTHQLCISEIKLHYYIWEELWYYFFFIINLIKIWTIGKKSLSLHTLLEKSADKAVRMRK